MKKNILIISLILVSCFSKKTDDAEIIIAIPKDLVSYEKDKKQIADCFINKIEYFRKYHNYDFEMFINSPDSIKKKHDDYYAKYLGADWDPENFFIPYASRFSLKEKKNINSPIATSEQLKVTTDAILYNKNQTICFAFVIIEQNYTILEGFKDEIKSIDAKAVIGLRNNKEEAFEIYPVSKYDVIGFGDANKAIKDIEKYYFTALKGDGLAGTQYEDKNSFNSNVGDADFFEKAPFFHKTNKGLYFFQLYQELGDLKEFKYQKCK